MIDLDRSKVIYLAAILALATAGTLAWAVSHPCDCEKAEQETVSVDGV